MARVNIEAAKELMLASNLKPLEEYPGGHLYADDAALYLDRLGDSVFNTGTDKERTNVFTVTQKVSS